MDHNELNFLLSFFEKDEYPGWKHIATALILKKECIAVGSYCIWNCDPIGEFISLNQSKKYVDCSEYKFDLEGFLNSETFKTKRDKYLLEIKSEISKLEGKFRVLQERYNDIKNL